MMPKDTIRIPSTFGMPAGPIVSARALTLCLNEKTRYKLPSAIATNPPTKSLDNISAHFPNQQAQTMQHQKLCAKEMFHLFDNPHSSQVALCF